MIRFAPAAVGLLLSTSTASALGLDRSGQDIGLIFEEGNFAQFSFGHVTPHAEGADNFLTGASYDNVADGFSVWSYGVKYDVGDRFSVAAILDQPYGADAAYPGNPAATLLGGTEAHLDSEALSVIGRFRISDAFSVHAGLRHVWSDADVTLSGIAYQGLSGYRVDLTNGSGNGWLAGVAYERPAIALRVALTYASEVELEFDSRETLNGIPAELLAPPGFVGDSTTVIAPESWNLDFQTGIARDTLLFGQIRRAAYADTLVSPDFFALATGGSSITDIETTTSYTLGVGRKLTERLSASVALGYEPASDDDQVSPLSPTNGQRSIQLGVKYDATDAIVVSGGVRYTMLGDATASVGGTGIADFSGSDALSLGVKVGYRF